MPSLSPCSPGVDPWADHWDIQGNKRKVQRNLVYGKNLLEAGTRCKIVLWDYFTCNKNNFYEKILNINVVWIQSTRINRLRDI